MNLRERNKAEKWFRIRTAAEALFAERGFEGTTIRGIAVAAEVSTGTVLLYGKTKHALLFRLFTERIGPDFERAMDTAPVAPWADRLGYLFAALITAYRVDLRLSRTLVKELPFLEGEPGTAHAEQFDRLMSFLVASCEMAQRAGEIEASLSPVMVSQAAFSLYYGALIALVNGLVPESAVGAMLRQSLHQQVRGLQPDSGASND